MTASVSVDSVGPPAPSAQAGDASVTSGRNCAIRRVAGILGVAICLAVLPHRASRKQIAALLRKHGGKTSEELDEEKGK